MAELPRLYRRRYVYPDNHEDPSCPAIDSPFQTSSPGSSQEVAEPVPLWATLGIPNRS